MKDIKWRLTNYIIIRRIIIKNLLIIKNINESVLMLLSYIKDSIYGFSKFI